MAIFFAPTLFIRNLLLGHRGITLDKKVWWFGRTHIISSMMMGAKECERYFAIAFTLGISAFIAKALENNLKGRLLTPIFSHLHYPVVPLILIIGACYKTMVGLITLHYAPCPGKMDMGEAFKDILSVKTLEKLPVFKGIGMTSEPASFDGRDIVVLQYWFQTMTSWERKTIAFRLDWDSGYVDNCENMDCLEIATAYLLKELFTKGQCDYEPLTYRKAKTSLCCPNKLNF